MTKQFNNADLARDEIVVENEQPEDSDLIGEGGQEITKAQTAMKNGDLHEKLITEQCTMVSKLNKKKVSKKFINKPKAFKEW